VIKRDRRNPDLDRAVRCGIIIDAELGSLSAWMFMANSGVSEAVILRVLLRSEERRETDKIALDIANMHRKLQKSPNVTRSAHFHLKKFQAEMT
jgi:hypothetical protein